MRVEYHVLIFCFSSAAQKAQRFHALDCLSPGSVSWRQFPTHGITLALAPCLHRSPPQTVLNLLLSSLFCRIFLMLIPKNKMCT